MQIVIDIPDHLYKLLKDFPSDSNEGTIENVLMKAVENGTPIPDNASNEDVMKIIFPSMKIEKHHSFARFVYGDESYIPCSYKWLDAPYQKGSNNE